MMYVYPSIHQCPLILIYMCICICRCVFAYMVGCIVFARCRISLWPCRCQAEDQNAKRPRKTSQSSKPKEMAEQLSMKIDDSWVFFLRESHDIYFV